MGNEVSKTQSGPVMSRPLPNDHMMMYNKILQIKSPQTRVNMLKTILSGPEFIHTAKQAGIYTGILQYIKAITYDEPGIHILPGETASQTEYPAITNKSSTNGSSSNAITIMHNGKAQKAKDYFNWSLEILGLADTDGLTVDVIKAAYKKAAARAHPDRQGGSDKAFKDVTKAAAYLTDIISKITGRRATTGVINIESETQQRKEDNDKWANFTPVTLDPKNLNMAAFNEMFEKTRIPDPDEDGYGDWLKDGSDIGTGNGRLNSKGDYEINKPGGDYNRDHFMRTFEDSLRSNNSKTNQQLILNPNAMALVAPIGTELGRDRPADYTSPFMSDVNYTDLRSAYTQNNTIMNHVANVRFEERSFDKYKSAYDAGPSALSSEEMELIRQSDKEIEDRERQRQLRHAQQDRLQLENSERLRSLLILNKPN
jgi:hypothetical protein